MKRMARNFVEMLTVFGDYLKLQSSNAQNSYCCPDVASTEYTIIWTSQWISATDIYFFWCLSDPVTGNISAVAKKEERKRNVNFKN